MSQNDLAQLATTLADETDTDIYLFSGPIYRPFDRNVIETVNAWNRRTNAALFLCTYGGDPNAAYRIARCFQTKYEKFTVYVLGFCKSSGTLLAMGANEVVVNENGEFGPLDIQLAKKDELSDMDSGLTVLNAIDELETKAFELFENGFLKLKMKSGGRITLKTATGIARELALGLISPIMSHIDPLHVGEVSRAMKIGKEYAERLNSKSKNLKDGAIEGLTTQYPSHGFVIDSEEAKSIFKSLREPNATESALIKSLAGFVKTPPQKEQESAPISCYISEQKPLGGEPDANSNAGESGDDRAESDEQ